MMHNRERTMDYWIVLVTVAAMSVFYYGLRAAVVIGLAAATAILTDLICLFLQEKPYRAENLISVGSAVVMVLMFPATIPYSIVILSTIFSTAIGIHAFGSAKDHLFPPAALGYVFALVSWKDEVLVFPKAGQFLQLFGNTVSLHSSYSSTVDLHDMYVNVGLDVLLGDVYGPMGTGCIILLLLGLGILLVRRSISFWSTLGFCFGIVTMGRILGMAPVRLLTTHMLLFAMLFLTGDRKCMRASSIGAGICGIFTGFLTVCLIASYHVEYAVVIAAVLSCPVWRGVAAVQRRIRHVLDASQEKENPAEGEECG